MSGWFFDALAGARAKQAKDSGGWGMEQEIIKMAASQGLFAVLFVALLFYVLRHNETREERLMACLESLTKSVGEIKNDMESLKTKLGGCK